MLFQCRCCDSAYRSLSSFLAHLEDAHEVAPGVIDHRPVYNTKPQTHIRGLKEERARCLASDS